MLEPNIAGVASLIGDPARAHMLIALMGGKALTATELALEAGITPQTASSHLGKLVDSGLVMARKQGRHKYFQLQGAEVAELLEMMLNLSTQMAPLKITTGPGDPNLRRARVCYDHLAGEVGVALYDALVAGKYLVDNGSETLLTATGRTFFLSQGMPLDEFNGGRRPLCKSCLDWSERRNHLAGRIGQWILEDTLARRWASRDPVSRAILFSTGGFAKFAGKYGLAGCYAAFDFRGR
ncbi:winged helix-turn-helix domain-containing protein [Microbulbifer sp. SAOS-129_SWC]|uniref:ArsR/SmtB family transcription factor n=1 Tax=Microbulbifer sp. SAOS-129_SWC TaxID=3145235 RepID=UPI003217279B